MGMREKIFGSFGKLGATTLRAPHWGVHPDDHKRPAADAPLRTLPLPVRLYVPLQQHIGQPARPIVLVGQMVLKGQAIAEANGNVSARIHAPASGRISAIGEITAPHASGLPVLAITIETDGAARAALTESGVDPLTLAPDEIARRIAAAGVVGLGGATFPAAVKLALGQRSAVTTLLMNGGECEPYLSCDDRVMRDFADDVVDGIRIMLRATGAATALVGIEDNKPEAIAAMTAAAHPFPEVEVRPLPARYPMGSERQLILMLTGREVPADARPADVGVVVHNVGTANAVHRALRQGEALTHRIVTVNGGAVPRPGNILVPIGALVADVLAFAGCTETPARLIMGGPMMGTALPHANVPVVKGTSGILALRADEVEASEAGPCIRCGSCLRACPMGLLPLDMAAHVRVDDLKGAVALGLVDCMACGCCSFVCPAHIPLVQYFSHAKGELAARERARLRQEASKRLAVARIERLEREAVEKAAANARRKAERAAAKAAEAAALAVAAPVPPQPANPVSGEVTA